MKAETGRTTHSEQSIFCLQIYKYNHHFVSKEHGNGWTNLALNTVGFVEEKNFAVKKNLKVTAVLSDVVAWLFSRILNEVWFYIFQWNIHWKILQKEKDAEWTKCKTISFFPK